MQLQPTSGKQRYAILDIWRGVALLGIILANYRELSLWSFMTDDERASAIGANFDSVVQYAHYIFVDAKFYTIFSLLFGIGFALILAHSAARGVSGIRLFYRRMTILAVIGLLHLLFLWSGDILLLYALVGMVLPLFHLWCKSTKTFLLFAIVAIVVIPVGLEAFQELSGISLSAWIEQAWYDTAAAYGIAVSDFARILKYGSLTDVHGFLMQGAVERMYEFVEGHRAFKVLGLFLIGYLMGRSKIYTKLPDMKGTLKKFFWWGLAIGLPSSVAYAWSTLNGQPLGKTAQALFYLLSALPMAACYMAGLSLLYFWSKSSALHKILGFFATTGRMALTNYIGQSVIGILLFYGIGLGLGCEFGLAGVAVLSLIVFVMQMAFSHFWIAHFEYGPLEWVWRMLTYGHRLPLKREETS